MANSILSQPLNPHNQPSPVVNEYLKTYDRLYERLSKIRSLIAVLQGQDVLSFCIHILVDYLSVMDDYAEGAHKTLAELDILQRQWIHLTGSSSETNQNSTQGSCQPSDNLCKKEAK